MALFEVEPSGLVGINAHYEKAVAPRLADMDAARREAIRRGWWMFGGLLALIVGIASFVWIERPEVDPLEVGGVAVVLAAMAYLFSMHAAKKIKTDHKHLVVGAMAEFIGYKYRPLGRPGMVDHFRGLGLLPSYDRKSTEDGIVGEVGGVSFRLTEAKLEQKKRSKKHTHWKTVFNGVLITMAFPREFKGQTVLKRDGLAVFGAIEGFFSGLERVELEDPVFEREFDVRGSDQVEARYLLTPTLMESLTNLSRGTRDMVAAFEGGSIHIAYQNSDLFEAGKLGSDLRDPSLARYVVRELQMIGVLADTLGLDNETRI